MNNPSRDFMDGYDWALINEEATSEGVNGLHVRDMIARLALSRADTDPELRKAITEAWRGDDK